MLADQIKSDLISALKAGEKLKVSVLRMLQSEVGYKQIDIQRPITDEDVVSVIAKEVKKRKEAIESFIAGGRKEQADIEQRELEILSGYMPAQLSEKEIETEIEKILNTLETKDFGLVMKVVAPMFRGRADGRLVSEKVRQYLSSNPSPKLGEGN